jgi:uncharacterized membrane protein
MGRNIKSNFLSPRFFAAGAWGTLCACICAPPVLVSAGCPVAAAFVYCVFAPVCHQISARSFELLGLPLAVCHRCFGIYLGLFLGSLIRNPWMHRSPRTRRRWVLAAIAPLAFDALLPWSGLWDNTPASRFATGLLFGIPIASLLVRGIEEFLMDAPWRRIAAGNSLLKEASCE